MRVCPFRRTLIAFIRQFDITILCVELTLKDKFLRNDKVD
mgnify:CR=1 FL=1